MSCIFLKDHEYAVKPLYKIIIFKEICVTKNQSAVLAKL